MRIGGRMTLSPEAGGRAALGGGDHFPDWLEAGGLCLCVWGLEDLIHEISFEPLNQIRCLEPVPNDRTTAPPSHSKRGRRRRRRLALVGPLYPLLSRHFLPRSSVRTRARRMGRHPPLKLSNIRAALVVQSGRTHPPSRTAVTKRKPVSLALPVATSPGPINLGPARGVWWVALRVAKRRKREGERFNGRATSFAPKTRASD